MDNKKYRVIFNGKIVEGYAPDKVQKNLARLFKVDESKVKQRLSRLPAVIIKNADHEHAVKYQEALKKAGIVCHIQAEMPEEVTPSEEGVSETVIPEKIKAQESAADNAPAASYTKADKKLYKVVFNGKTTGEADIGTVKRKVAALFKLDKSRVERKLSKIPVNIIKDVDLEKATKYRIKLLEAGLMCDIEPMEAETAKSAAEAEAEKVQAVHPGKSSSSQSVTSTEEPRAQSSSLGKGKSKSVIQGSPSFAYIDIELAPGDSIIAESDAMSSMSADLDVKAAFNGGFFSGLMKKFFGGESLFINVFTNNRLRPRRLILTQATPGDIREITLNDESICLQPGAYICSTPELKLNVKWAGFTSWFAREGLFKLDVKGTGKLWYGAYGGLLEKKIDGEYIVDTSHLVAYEPQMKLKTQLAGGIFTSFFSGEGFVTRVEGKGTIIIQTRSMNGLAGWLNPKLSP